MKTFDMKARREELGLTMKQVAEACGVAEGTVSRWESGKIGNMKRNKIAALAAVLRVSPIDVMDGKEEDTVDNAEEEYIRLFKASPDKVQNLILQILRDYNS